MKYILDTDSYLNGDAQEERHKLPEPKFEA